MKKKKRKMPPPAEQARRRRQAEITKKPWIRPIQKTGRIDIIIEPAPAGNEPAEVPHE